MNTHIYMYIYIYIHTYYTYHVTICFRHLPCSVLPVLHVEKVQLGSCFLLPPQSEVFIGRWDQGIVKHS